MRATRLAALLAALAAGLVLVATVSAGDSQPVTVGPGDHVLICHALGEDNKDSYIAIAPSAGVVFGHAGDEHQLGQDIIPPFIYVDNQGDENDSLQDGQNWDAEGRDIWKNGCATPEAETTLTVNKVCVPVGDGGKFNVKIDGGTAKTDALCGEGTGSVVVSIGGHVVSEGAGTGTVLSDYTSVISGACDAQGNVSLAAGENKTCTITNTHTIAPTDNGGGNERGNPGAAAPVLDLSIAKSASPTQVKVGGTITWTITVKNNGATGATNVKVTDALPSKVTFVSASPSQGSCDGTSCDLGPLTSGATATITVVTTATAAGQLVNTASVTASESESNTANNTATAAAAATKGGVFKPPARRCGSIKLQIKQLSVGKRTVLRITVRDTRGKALRGAKVTVKGGGVAVTRRTGRNGVVTIAVKPKRAGILRISAGSARCSKRLGVLGAFQPPLTG